MITKSIPFSLRVQICLLLGLIFFNAHSQTNLVLNPSFEATNPAVTWTGAPFFNLKVPNWYNGCCMGGVAGNIQGTADIFIPGQSCPFDVPANRFALNRYAQHGNNYAGGYGSESLIGSLSESLGQCTYEIRFWVAPSGGQTACGGSFVPSSTPFTTNFQVLLRNSGTNCSTPGNLVWTSNPVSLVPGWNAVWQEVVGTFTINAAQAGSGYDRFELRQQNCDGDWVYLDNVSITQTAGGSTANVQPVSYASFISADSYYGKQIVYKFCEGDVIVDGSASVNENAYHLDVRPIDLATWSTGPSIYAGWITGQAPSSIDLTNQFGVNANFVVGQTYLLAFAVGPCWDVEYMLFQVKECCPKPLTLDINCETNQVYISNLPASATIMSATWKRKIGPVWIPMPYASGQSSVNVNAPGTYSVTVSFGLADGTICKGTASIVYTNDYCCTQTGPIAQLHVQPADSVGFVTVNTIPWGNQIIPIVDCDGFRLSTAGTQCGTGYFLYIEPFDPVSWTSTGPAIYSISGPVVPSTFNINQNNVPYQENQFYIIAFGYTSGGPVYYKVVKIQDCSVKSMISPSNEMSEANDSFDFELAPNPADEAFTIMMNQMSSGTFTLLTLDGKTVSSGKFAQTNTVIFESALFPAGIYLVDVEVNGVHLTKRLTIQ